MVLLQLVLCSITWWQLGEFGHDFGLCRLGVAAGNRLVLGNLIAWKWLHLVAGTFGHGLAFYAEFAHVGFSVYADVANWFLLQV